MDEIFDWIKEHGMENIVMVCGKDAYKVMKEELRKANLLEKLDIRNSDAIEHNKVLFVLKEAIDGIKGINAITLDSYEVFEED